MCWISSYKDTAKQTHIQTVSMLYRGMKRGFFSFRWGCKYAHRKSPNRPWCKAVLFTQPMAAHIREGLYVSDMILRWCWNGVSVDGTSSRNYWYSAKWVLQQWVDKALTQKVLPPTVNHSLSWQFKCTSFQGELQSTLALKIQCTMSLLQKLKWK